MHLSPRIILDEAAMRLGLACDHAGFELKQRLTPLLRDKGHEFVDFGAYQLDLEDDYPDFVIPLARAVAGERVERGLIICGSGVGASIAANKISGIRAGLCHDLYSARQGVEHDDMNILCLGGRVVSPELAWELVETFLAARFTAEQRHVRRLQKIAELER